MVDMIDFMAYLDRVIMGLDTHVFKLQKEKVSRVFAKARYCGAAPCYCPCKWEWALSIIMN